MTVAAHDERRFDIVIVGGTTWLLVVVPALAATPVADELAAACISYTTAGFIVIRRRSW